MEKEAEAEAEAETNPATGSLLYFLVKLNLVGPKGIPITQLFDKWSTTANGQEELNAIWRGLFSQQDVLMVESGAPLSKSPLAKLSYNDLVSLGLASKSIRIKSPRWKFPSEIPVGKLPWPEILDTEAGRCAQHIACHTDNWTSYHEWDAIVREPMPIPGWNSWSSYIWGGTGGAPARTTSTKASPTHSAWPSHAPDESTQGNQGDQNVTISQQDSSTLDTGVGRSGNESSSRAHPQEPPAIQHTANDDVLQASPSEQSGPLPETPRRRGPRARLNSAVRSSPRGASGGWHDGRPIREAVYTSYEELQYQDGVPGVYVGLPGTENPNRAHLRRKPTLVAVFKHSNLKDDQHLQKRAGSWRTPLAERVQKDLELVEETTKRPKRNQSGRNAKRQKKNKAPDHLPPAAEDTQTPEPDTPLAETPTADPAPKAKRKYTKRQKKVAAPDPSSTPAEVVQTPELVGPQEPSPPSVTTPNGDLLATPKGPTPVLPEFPNNGKGQSSTPAQDVSPPPVSQVSPLHINAQPPNNALRQPVVPSAATPIPFPTAPLFVQHQEMQTLPPSVGMASSSSTALDMQTTSQLGYNALSSQTQNHGGNVWIQENLGSQSVEHAPVPKSARGRGRGRGARLAPQTLARVGLAPEAAPPSWPPTAPNQWQSTDTDHSHYTGSSSVSASTGPFPVAGMQSNTPPTNLAPYFQGQTQQYPSPYSHPAVVHAPPYNPPAAPRISSLVARISNFGRTVPSESPYSISPYGTPTKPKADAIHNQVTTFFQPNFGNGYSQQNHPSSQFAYSSSGTNDNPIAAQGVVQHDASINDRWSVGLSSSAAMNPNGQTVYQALNDHYLARGRSEASHVEGHSRPQTPAQQSFASAEFIPHHAAPDPRSIRPNFPSSPRDGNSELPVQVPESENDVPLSQVTKSVIHAAAEQVKKALAGLGTNQEQSEEPGSTGVPTALPSGHDHPHQGQNEEPTSTPVPQDIAYGVDSFMTQNTSVPTALQFAVEPQVVSITPIADDSTKKPRKSRKKKVSVSATIDDPHDAVPLPRPSQGDAAITLSLPAADESAKKPRKSRKRKDSVNATVDDPQDATSTPLPSEVGPAITPSNHASSESAKKPRQSRKRKASTNATIDDPQETPSTALPSEVDTSIAAGVPVADESTQKPRRSGKRKLPANEVGEDAQNTPKRRVQPRRKRQTSTQQGLGAETAQDPTMQLNRSDQLAEVLRTAANRPFPPDQTRLPCLYTQSAGNLILSKDLSSLEFFSIDQRPPELPILTLPVSKIAESPITSVRGSNPMQLRIKVTGENGDDDELISHTFIYGSFQASLDFAAEMRQKIVVAMIAEKLKAGTGYQRPVEAEEAILKPFQCTSCQQRFKNPNGLQYHLTKSNTTCNPTFDPATAKPRGGWNRKLKEGSDLDEPTEPPIETPRKTRARKSVVIQAEESEHEFASAVSSPTSETSEDSAVGFFRKKARIEGSKVTSMRSSGKPYKALNKETEVLRGILDKFHEGTDEDVEVPASPSPFSPSLPSLASLADQISSTGKLNDAGCRDMVMALVCANNDIFLAPYGVWMACVALWLKMHPDAQALPRSTLVTKAIDDLVAEKKLESEKFGFSDRKSRHTVRRLIYVAGTDTSEEKCHILKTKTKETHPRTYVPSHLAPPPAVLDSLQLLANRQLANPLTKELRVGDADDTNTPESQPQGNVSDLDESDLERLADQVEAEEDADFRSDNKRTKATSKKRKRSGGQKPDRAETNSKISAGVRKMWAEIKAGTRQHPNFASRAPKAGTPSWKQRPTIGQQSSRTWHSAPAFIPNHSTGAWDQPAMAKTKPGPKPGQKKPSFYYFREPITYMQAMDGSWSVRPFGHGVKPIHARPARRADGNPNLPSYLRRIEDGHRPIIAPDPKNRIYLPGIPSKAITKQLALGLPVTMKTIKKRQSQGRRARDDSESPPPEMFDEDSASDFEEENSELMDFDEPPPKRRYTRRSSQFEDIDLMEDSNADDDVVLLEPKKLGTGAASNPGLDTLPPRYGLPASMYQGPLVNTLDYPQKYFSVIFTEQKYMNEDVEGHGEWSWTLRKLKTSGDSYEVQWNDNFAFTPQTLPYSDLVEDDELPSDTRQVPQKRRKLSSSQPKFKRQFKPVIGQPSEKQKIAWTRSQVHLTTDVAELNKMLNKTSKEIAAEYLIEVTQPNQATKKRARQAAPGLTSTEESRFVIAVVIQRILTGGLDLAIDWVLISTIFQAHTMNFLKRYWMKISEGKDALMTQLGRDFQAAYPAAYRKGKVPPFDWNDLVGNDWHGLITWVQNNVASVFCHKDVATPHSRAELNAKFDMEEAEMENEWRETYFNVHSMKYKRVEAAATEPLVIPTRKPIAEDKSDDVLTSWVRAIALTPEEDWEAGRAAIKDKLIGVNGRTISRIVTPLFNSKVLMHVNKGRPVAGRSYKATDAFYANLRKHMKQTQFIEAITYKRLMDEQFRSKTPCLMVDHMADEGSVLALTSLQAAGRIKIQCQNVPMQKFGLTDEGYETKKISKDKITFDMAITPTSSYIYNDENEILNAFFDATPPKDEEEGKIPVWYGISEVLILDIWKRVLVAICQTVALRSGIDVDGLTRIFKPTLEKWEVVLLMDWGVEVGLFERFSETVEGWTVNEWWWVAVGGVCTL